MTKITTDFVGTETLAQTKERFGEILDFWLGGDSLSGVTDWGQVRDLLNSVSPNTVIIANGELGSSFRPKINNLNNTDTVVDSILFSAEEVGVWFDPTDITTLFQDTAGTTPVTTPGQTVARINDKSGNGFNATQATAGSRPTYGIVPETGRRNLLARTEEFDNAVWEKVAGANVSNIGVMAGRPIWRVFNEVGTNAGARVQQEFVSFSGSVTISLVARANEGGVICAQIGASVTKQMQFDTTSATFFTSGLGAPFAPDIIHQAEFIDGYWHLRVTYTGMTNVTNCAVFANRRTSDTNQFVDVNLIQYETGTTATPYQRVGTRFDVTEAGVPSLGYLSFDGVDDFLVTPTITPNTDKVQVFAGARKLSDAAAMIAELGPLAGTTNGSIALFHSSTASFSSRGTAIRTAAVGWATAPASAVFTGLGDIPAPLAALRRDAGSFVQNTGSQGTGNYRNDVIYIGHRAGTSLPFNGHIHQLIVRFGPNLSTLDIQKIERYVASNTAEVTI